MNTLLVNIYFEETMTNAEIIFDEFRRVENTSALLYNFNT